jgi:hypothetical protein
MFTALLLLAMLLEGDDGGLGAGNHSRTVRVGNLDRQYLVHVPLPYDPAVPTPLVMKFHGGGANAANMATLSGRTYGCVVKKCLRMLWPRKIRRTRTALPGNSAGRASGARLVFAKTAVTFPPSLDGNVDTGVSPAQRPA